MTAPAMDAECVTAQDVDLSRARLLSIFSRVDPTDTDPGRVSGYAVYEIGRLRIRFPWTACTAPDPLRVNPSVARPRWLLYDSVDEELVGFRLQDSRGRDVAVVDASACAERRRMSPGRVEIWLSDAFSKAVDWDADVCRALDRTFP